MKKFSASAVICLEVSQLAQFDIGKCPSARVFWLMRRSGIDTTHPMRLHSCLLVSDADWKGVL
jgi:hypothetical protein